MRGAVIDLGTNTFNLLIFEKRDQEVVVLHTDRVPVGLGMGGINEKIIAPEAFARGVQTISDYVDKANAYQVDQIRAFGTSAMRDARNVDSFLQQVREKSPISIEVIDGKREAELIYKGVQSIHKFDEKTCIMDIGGGSTEFIFADAGGYIASESFNIGISRLLQGLDLSDPMDAEDITLIEEYFEYKTSGFFQRQKADVLIGASGSFETFYTLMGNTKDLDQNTTFELDAVQLQEVLDNLILSTQAERDQLDNIVEIRKKMIHIAALKTKWLIDQIGAKRIFVSPASLKEGVMIEMIEQK